jgi:hypothetical protein
MRLALLLVLYSTLFSSKAQTIAELDKRNGFKSIKLGYPIDSVKGYLFQKDLKEKDEFPVKLYTVMHDDYKKIGDVTVQAIRVLTYQNLIYKIFVTTDKDPRLMKALERAFGKSTYVVRTSSYNWKAENLSLYFMAGEESIELTYRSYPLIAKMKADKNKKIDVIADDF